MSRENRFGKWGAWVAAAGLAIGGVHEMSKSDGQPKTAIVKDVDVEQAPEEDAPGLPEKKIEDTEDTKNADLASKKITNKIEERTNEEKEKAKKFLDQINQQLQRKMSEEEIKKLEEKYAGGGLVEGDEEGSWTIRRNEYMKKKKLAEEYAKTNPKFDKIQKFLDANLPNATIRDFDGKYNIHQEIYYTDDKTNETKKMTLNIPYDIWVDSTYEAKNGIDEDFVVWTAKDEQTFLKQLTKQAQADLLGQKLREGEELEDHAPIATMLKARGLFDEYQDLLRPDDSENASE